jgi:hypothetical protein
MNVKHDIDNIRLTSSEIGELFSVYTFNSASKCELSYFIKKVHDPDIKSVLEFALDSANKAVKQVADIFNTINHPIPKGFSDDDVNVNAKKLFSDRFMLTFVRFMARFELTNYSEARASCIRADVVSFFDDCIRSTIELFDMADEVLLKKGLYTRAPYIPIPDSIDFVRKQSFLNGFFGEKRPLNASEINRLYLNFQRNSLGKAFLTGLSQITRNKEIQDYLLRGKKLCEKHMEVVGSFLKQDDLPTPPALDSEVTDSTDPVFSDKLIMLHVAVLAGLGLGVNGVSLSKVMRRDISLAITRLMAEIALYEEDGFNIIIENEWFERIPEAVNRKELLEV